MDHLQIICCPGKEKEHKGCIMNNQEREMALNNKKIKITYTK